MSRLPCKGYKPCGTGRKQFVSTTDRSSCRARHVQSEATKQTSSRGTSPSPIAPPLYTFPTFALPLPVASNVSELGYPTDFDQQYVRGILLGSGSFGQVHLAVNLQSGQEVAVKQMPKVRNKLSREKTLEKIKREVQILDSLQGCPGAVRLDRCFEDAEHVHVVTEMCHGGDLQKVSDALGGFSEQALALVAVEVLKIVKACHTLGIVHGDVKPANFCLKQRSKDPIASPESVPNSGWLKAIDFGCSQYSTGFVNLNKRTGTPVYMAPEVFARDYSFPADLWSTGVMLYQLFTRRFPFWEDFGTCRASSLEEVSDAVRNAEITYDYGPWHSMSAEGLDFMKRCLTRSPQDRLTIDQALAHPWLAPILDQQVALGSVGNHVVTEPLAQHTVVPTAA